MTGAESRVNSLADALSRSGVEVHVFARKRADDLTVCRGVQFHASPWLKELMPDRVSPMSIALVSAAQIRSLRHLIDSCSFDIVQSSGMTVAPYGLVLSRLQRAACVLDEPDAEFEKMREMHNAGNWHATFLTEKVFAQTARHVLTSSIREKRIMTRFFHLKDQKVSIIPNGVNTSRFLPSAQSTEFKDRLRLAGRKVVLFMGNFDYFPNIDSVNIITRELVPRVTQTVPDVTFMVIGKGLPASLIPNSANTLPVGFVEDPRPYIEAADVCIAPIRYGGGTRIKILEYMSMGRAVVSTSKGSEGLQVTDGVDILVRDDWSAFSRGIVSLLKESENARKMGLEARKTAIRHYDWSNIADELVHTYKRIIDL
jgi:glycosyltransferase involved in cell wall biosynthesis